LKLINLLPLLGLAAAACFAPADALHAAGELKLSPAQIAALGVETVPLSAPRLGELQGLPARVVVPNHQLRVLSAPLAGLVEQVAVATEQPVRKGQFLLRLHSSSLAEVQRTFLQAATQLELATTRRDRDEKLFADGIIAESRVEAARTHRAESAADYAERTQALRLAGMSDAAIGELRAGRRVDAALELSSPIEGIVLEQLAVAGQRVDASAPLLKIGRLDPLWLEIEIPAARLAGVRAGAAVRVPAADAEAKVLTIGRSINRANQTVTVRAVTTRGAERLRPGQSLEVTLAELAVGGEWNIPTGGISRTAGTATVFVKTPAGFRAQQVRIVSEGAEQTVVAGALKSSDRIAVKGIAALKAALAGIGGP